MERHTRINGEPTRVIVSDQSQWKTDYFVFTRKCGEWMLKSLLNTLLRINKCKPVEYLLHYLLNLIILIWFRTWFHSNTPDSVDDKHLKALQLIIYVAIENILYNKVFRKNANTKLRLYWHEGWRKQKNISFISFL